MGGSLWLEMNERPSDFALLREFARKGRHPAFATLARRHLDLVYGTAFRKVRDAGGAEEIAQNVFCALARKAWQFAPDDSLPAWLHKTALLECKFWLRGELRRRRREETAAELGTTMKAPDDQPAFNALVPLLDDALLSLREKDRTALLLRYYEGQSLRDVGGAFGIGEDTAQKRVRGALEKVSQFFQRRGFRTATVAATAAALQHSATSASPTLLSAVLAAASKIAPPALVGLAFLARLASLTRMQTAVVCVTLAAAPVAWQWNERHAAGDQLTLMRSELLAAQNTRTAVQAEVDRLQADSAKLEQALAQANEAVARGAASAQAFADWKQKMRAPLLAADYRWDDASPFVRIPKASLPGLSELVQLSAITPPGVVNPYERELLGLTSSERQALEATLQRVAELQRGEQAEVYEVEKTPSGRVVASREFKNQPPGKVGPEAEQRFAQMLADLRGVLGEERWAALPTRVRTVDCRVLNGMLIPAPTATLWVTVENNQKGIPEAKWLYTGNAFNAPTASPNPPKGNVYSLNVVGYVNNSAPLSSFVAEGDANLTTNLARRVGSGAPEALGNSATAWFQQQARVRLNAKEKP